MTTRKMRALVGLLAFALLVLITFAVAIPKIENDLTHRVERQLTTAGVGGVVVSFSGRDGTLSGPAGAQQAALAAVTDRWGIRSLSYVVSGADVVIATTTTAPPPVTVPSTTPASTTTVAATTTTSTTTSTPTATTSAPTTEPTSTPSVPTTPISATATIAGGTITLSGVVASNGQEQTLTDAAATAFLPQGTVVDELTVGASPPDGASDNAVLGLASFITAAGPSLLSGSAVLADTNLSVTGQGFNAAATDAANQAIATSGSQLGLTIDGTVTDGLTAPEDLQPVLTALLGRSGVNFDRDSAVIDPASQAVLDTAAASILEQPANVEVLGYTDNSGSESHNLALSQERADAVRDYLIGKGVAADSLTATGKGEADPIADNGTAEGRAKNRRIELHVQGG